MTPLSIFIGEIFGTALLTLLGCGVVAGVLLNKSKANNAGWIVISFGWGFGVMAGAYFSLPLSGGHLNPAVTIGLAIASGDWSTVHYHIAGEIIGAMLGAGLMWLAYLGQFGATKGPYLGIFSTVPEIRSPWRNLLTEIVATFVLVFVIVATGQNDEIALSGTGTLIVALLVVGIGLSLGGPTGYAINPARDLGPRIMHQLLPIRGKGSSDWKYAWVPVVGPLIGGSIGGGLGALVYSLI